jgi:cytochrome c-type biogenesis protein CcmF
MTATWGGHEGSWLLWLVLLSGYLLICLRSQGGQITRISVESPITAAVVLGLGGFMLSSSNPFLRTLPIPPPNGQDLNPLLQDIGFIMHPPCLYLGYVSLVIPFILCVRVLINQGLPEEDGWIREVRAWALWGWSWLTLGITLGSWWAYRELGWGGFWFWDPVENASLMPWLVLTAIIHQTACKSVSGKIGLLFLGVTGFITTLLGTFLVRSGIVVSVHAFAVDPLRGQYILLLLTAVAIPTYTLWARKYAHLVVWCQQETELPRKERWLQTQAAIMLGMLLVIVVATLYPLWVELVWGSKISVGPGYFEQVLAPLVWGLFYAMGAEQLEKAPHNAVWYARSCAAGACILTGALVWWMMQVFGQSASIVTTITCFFAIWAAVPLLTTGSTQLSGKNLAHGMVIAILACVVLSKSYEKSQIYTVQPGEKVTFMGYDWLMDSVWRDKQENYLRQRVKVIKEGPASLTLVWPELRYYPSQESTQTKAYIERGLWGDWYVAVSKLQQGDDFLLRLYYKPMLCLLWLCGTGLFIAGLVGLRAHLLRDKRGQGNG